MLLLFNEPLFSLVFTKIYDKFALFIIFLKCITALYTSNKRFTGFCDIYYLKCNFK